MLRSARVARMEPRPIWAFARQIIRSRKVARACHREARQNARVRAGVWHAVVMTRAERERAIDTVPTGDPDAAVAEVQRLLEETGELDDVLVTTLAVRAGKANRVMERVEDLWNDWRARRGLPWAELPFVLGE